MTLAWNERMPLHALSTPTKPAPVSINTPRRTAGLPKTLADTALTAALSFDIFSISGASNRVGQGTAMRKKITGNAK